MTVVPFLHGAVSLGCAVIAVFFLRFWRQSADRLFLFFAVAFGVLALDYLVLGVLDGATEWRVPVFAVRLSAFLVILLGILDKNRR
jgi:hypothetical protein